MAGNPDSVINDPPVPPWVKRDPEWAAAVWLLRWNATIWRRSYRHVDFTDGVIHFDRIADSPWSSGERRIVECAWSLYNDSWAKEEGHAVSIGDLVSDTLGDRWLNACLTAVAIRRGKRTFDDAEAPEELVIVGLIEPGECDGCMCCSAAGCHNGPGRTCPTDSLGESVCPCTVAV